MRKPAVLLAGAITLFATATLLSATNSAFSLIEVTSYEADVNKDGNVSSIDLMLVAQRFGQPVPTATPDRGHDVVLSNEVTASAGIVWLGAYRPDSCQEPVIVLHATSPAVDGAPSFDFLLAPSVDAVSPSAIQNVGNSSSMGLAGQWHTHRKVSRNTSGAVQGGGNQEPYAFGEPESALYPFVMVGAQMNHVGTLRGEVHCSRSPSM